MRSIITTVLCFVALSIMGQNYSQELERSAKTGLPSAQRELGVCYLFGYGVKANDKKAQKWLEGAVEGFHPDVEAYYWLGYMYENGHIQSNSSMMDELQCVTYYKKAADGGIPQAAYRMYAAFSGNSNIDKRLIVGAGRKEDWLSIAAEGGIVDAIYEQAMNASNPSKKLELLKKAAAQGHQLAKSSIPVLEASIKAEQERLEAEKEAERKRSEELAIKEKQAKIDFQEGKVLASLPFLRNNTLFLSWDKELGNASETNKGKFMDLCRADFIKLMGLENMDELDVLRYKNSEKYKEDQAKFDEELNQIFTYVINLQNDYPKSSTQFSTKGFTINIQNDGSPYKRIDQNHIKCWYSSIYFPIQPNIASVENSMRKLFFPCTDLDLLYKMKDNISFLSLVILCKPGISQSYEYFANPISMYIVDKDNGNIVMDLTKYIRSISSESEKKKEIAYLEADLKDNKAEYEKRRGKYHETPKQVRCIFCWGLGYIKHKQNDIVVDVDRCFHCYGKGYTMEHYY